MAEWFKAAVSKTVECKISEGSNPSRPANQITSLNGRILPMVCLRKYFLNYRKWIKRVSIPESMNLVNAPTALCKGGGDRPSGNSVGVLLGCHMPP